MITYLVQKFHELDELIKNIYEVKTFLDLFYPMYISSCLGFCTCIAQIPLVRVHLLIQ